jgi:hypothetical protein
VTGDIVIRGLAINRFETGIEVKDYFSQVHIEGNFIGIDVTGSTPIAGSNQLRGVEARNVQ